MTGGKRIFCFTGLIFLFSLQCNAQYTSKDTMLPCGKKISFIEISEAGYNAIPVEVEVQCHSFESCDSIEKIMIAKHSENVKRDKWMLFLSLSNGKNTVLTDSVMTSDFKYILNDSMWNKLSGELLNIETKYQFIDYFDEIGYYFLQEYFIEGGSYMLVSRNKGSRIYFPFLTMFPQFGAGKNTVLFCSYGAYAAFSGYQVWSIYPDSIHTEWTMEYPTDAWMPYECRWGDDHTFYAMEFKYPVEHNSENWNMDNFKKRYLKIKF